jgi:branched-chain amino acid transport system substrate-binding protein
MNNRIRKAISTTVVAIVIVIIVIAAGVGVYLATATSKATTTTTTTTTNLTTTTTGVPLSSTTTTSSTPTSSATSSASTCNTNQLVFCFPTIPKGSNATLSGNKTVTIGVMTDLTGELSSIGVGIGKATQLAAQDVNAWIKANDSSWSGAVTFQVDVMDYDLGSGTTKAQNDLSAFSSSGVSVVIGPLDSGTVGALYSTSQSDNIVMLSPSSTSVLLAGVSPYLYRTVPNDAFQGQADAREFYQNGVRQLIIVYTNQAYGSGLANATAARFSALGGTVSAKIPYDPTTTDFTSILTTLNSQYSSAVSSAGGNKSQVAIFAIGYQEIGTLLSQAQTQGYGNTLLNTSQPWYGSDGEAANSAFTNSTFASVSAEVRLPSTLYAPTNTTKTNSVCQAIDAMSAGGCSGYSLGAYDDVWLTAVATLQCGTYTGSCLSKAIGQVANESVGVTGPETLGSNHDRIAYAYDIFAVTTVSGTVQWVLAGNWTVTTDKVVWNPQYEPKY